MTSVDTDKLEGERRRGQEAEALLEHPLWVEARAAIKKRLMDEWAASPVRDNEARERIWMMMRMATLLEDHIRQFATTGRLASTQLTDLGERKKLLGII